jgi:predicted RNA-binding Zn ribbon-like protein
MSLPSWVPDGEAKPAPVPLLLVQSFVNTWEGDSGADLLADPTSAEQWLGDAGLLMGRGGIAGGELAQAREVRESIRSLLTNNGGGPVPGPSELKALRDLARTKRYAVTMAADGHLDVHDVGQGQIRLARLVLVIRDSQQDGTWGRLKACHNSECRWAFYDRSHAGRGAWCDMAVCGNRVKNRTLRWRRASGDGIPRGTSRPAPAAPI